MIEMAVLVHVGLLEFRALKGLQTETAAQDIDQLLRDSLRKLTGESQLPSWYEAQQSFARALKYAAPHHPLKRLVEDYPLSVPQVFVLGLVGETETSYAVNLTLAELQAPGRQARPSLHLVLAMLETLFPVTEFAPSGVGAFTEPKTAQSFAKPVCGNLSIFALSEQALVRDQFLHILGDEPLPLRHLQVAPALWSLLSGRPGNGLTGSSRVLGDSSLLGDSRCEPVPPADIANLSQSLVQQLPKLANLLGGKVLREKAPQKEACEHVEADLKTAGVVLRSLPNRGGQAFAYCLAQALGLQAVNFSSDLWRDQPALRNLCRYANWLPVISPSLGPGEILSLPRLAKPHPLLIILGSDGAVDAEGFIEIHAELPTQAERVERWLSHLDDQPLAEHLAAGAHISLLAITQVAHYAKRLAYLGQDSTPEKIPGAESHSSKDRLDLPLIAQARRMLDAEKLRLLAQPVEREVRAEQLVMPTMVEEGLQSLVQHALQRESLWAQLGKTAKISRSAGVRALFVGESGTGKTLAASYIATALSAPLYRVDLAAVMNKYIGESEKNLSQLLDYAAANDVVLLFDEADALFGTRSEGKETGERFANMLTNFLLTRIENHPGIVILTTNNRQRIDQAFTRRLDTIVEFPLPGFEERLALWRSHLGEGGRSHLGDGGRSQLGEGGRSHLGDGGRSHSGDEGRRHLGDEKRIHLDGGEHSDLAESGLGEAVYRQLASYCDLAGGQVRNVVLAAAVAAAGKPITLQHLTLGLEAEYRKQGRSLPAKIHQMAAA